MRTRTRKGSTHNNTLLVNSWVMAKSSVPVPMVVAREVATVSTDQPTNIPRTPKNCKVGIYSGISAVVVLLVVIVIASKSFNSTGSSDDFEWTTVDFSTGASLITYYGVKTTIKKRAVRTFITMEVSNALDCSSIHGVTFQLPRSAHVSTLETTSSDGCTTRGVVQNLGDVRDVFKEVVSSGLPAGYIEEGYDDRYSLQVAIPPLGSTRVEVVVEDVIHQHLGTVDFQIPWLPDEQVDDVSFHLVVEDLDGRPASFSLDLHPRYLADSTNHSRGDRYDNVNGNSTSSEEEVTWGSSTNAPSLVPVSSGDEYDFVWGGSNGEHTTPNSDVHETNEWAKTNLLQTIGEFRLEVADAREHTFPRVLRGMVEPDKISSGGVVYSDGSCFEYYFRPEKMPTMGRNFLFLLDATSPLDGPHSATITALKQFIDTLTTEDTLTIQTFAREGSLELWGIGFCTEEEKRSAKAFLDTMVLEVGEPVNLQQAVLEGLSRFRKRTIADRIERSVNIMVIFCHNDYTTGAYRAPGATASDVFKLNQELKVNIFTMGSSYADTDLLPAIALMNGGEFGAIEEDSPEPIETFLQSRVGKIVMTNLAVNISGSLYTTIPLLVEGNEAVVRGLLEGESLRPHIAITAATESGILTWNASSVSQQNTVDTTSCFRKYAHTRIRELKALQDVWRIEDEVLNEFVKLRNTSCTDGVLSCMKQEQVSLAMAADLVVFGLTAMTTVDEENCLPDFKQEEELLCRDGFGLSERAAPYQGFDFSSSSMEHPFLLCLAAVVGSIFVLAL